MDEHDLGPDPVLALRSWLQEGQATHPQDAIALATATPGGVPSVRVVLLRGLDERGLVFFTNRRSRKGRELEANPHAALVFHWPELGRQVRVEGPVETVDEAETAEYWTTRPRESRIAAWASPQSQPIAARGELDALYASSEDRFAAGDVPLPDFWGGYRVVPSSFEFWTHRENRLHDRIRFLRSPRGWRAERLAP
jgi:pyridoxamine 5'-phosphate oxidase